MALVPFRRFLAPGVGSAGPPPAGEAPSLVPHAHESAGHATPSRGLLKRSILASLHGDVARAGARRRLGLARGMRGGAAWGVGKNQRSVQPPGGAAAVAAAVDATHDYQGRLDGGDGGDDGGTGDVGAPPDDADGGDDEGGMDTGAPPAQGGMPQGGSWAAAGEGAGRTSTYSSRGAGGEGPGGVRGGGQPMRADGSYAPLEEGLDRQRAMIQAGMRGGAWLKASDVKTMNRRRSDDGGGWAGEAFKAAKAAAGPALKAAVAEGKKYALEELKKQAADPNSLLRQKLVNPALNFAKDKAVEVGKRITGGAYSYETEMRNGVVFAKPPPEQSHEPERPSMFSKDYKYRFGDITRGIIGAVRRNKENLAKSNERLAAINKRDLAQRRANGEYVPNGGYDGGGVPPDAEPEYVNGKVGQGWSGAAPSAGARCRHADSAGLKRKRGARDPATGLDSYHPNDGVRSQGATATLRGRITGAEHERLAIGAPASKRSKHTRGASFGDGHHHFVGDGHLHGAGAQCGGGGGGGGDTTGDTTGDNDDEVRGGAFEWLDYINPDKIKKNVERKRDSLHEFAQGFVPTAWKQKPAVPAYTPPTEADEAARRAAQAKNNAEYDARVAANRAKKIQGGSAATTVAAYAAESPLNGWHGGKLVKRPISAATAARNRAVSAEFARARAAGHPITLAEASRRVKESRHQDVGYAGPGVSGLHQPNHPLDYTRGDKAYFGRH